MARHRLVRNRKYPDIWTAVYRLYNAAGRLLYVGVAYDFAKRFKDHAKDKTWWPQVAHKDVVLFDNRLDAMWEETWAINVENPIHNDYPGLSERGITVLQKRVGWQQGEACPVAPDLALTVSAQMDVLKEMRHGSSTHLGFTIKDEMVAALVPYDFFVELCSELGKPIPLPSDADLML